MNKKAIILLGPPAVGKGSVSALLALLGYKVISMSDFLRSKIDSDEQFKANFLGMVNGGQLVPDNFILEVLFERITEYNESSIVLDGCTRTLAQKEAVYNWLIKNSYDVCFLYLMALEQVCIHRMGIRTEELQSNGGIARIDDRDERAKRNRLRQFYDNIDPIWNSIKDCKLEVDANRSKDIVFIDVLRQLGYRNFL